MSKTYKNIFYVNVRWEEAGSFLNKFYYQSVTILYIYHTSLKEFVKVNNLPGYFLYFTSSCQEEYMQKFYCLNFQILNL